MPSPVFISYRRSDSQHATGRLFSRLAPRYLAEADIFMDVEAIAAGSDFTRILDHHLRSCKVCLVMIGPGWLAADASGQRRLDEPTDVVRQEVAAVLSRPEITVIPVLVDNARMPSATELPADLKALAVRNAVRVTHENFPTDVDALAARVLGALGRSVDLEQDLLRLFFSFKGSIGRKQFWIGVVTVLALQYALAPLVYSALNIQIGKAMGDPMALPRQAKILELLANGWMWWPLLALSWKRIRDLDHGWELFAPLVIASAASLSLNIAGMETPAAWAAGAAVILIIVLGIIKGTRFVAHNA